MTATLRCARAGVTTGEWAGALREVFGEYRAPTGVSGAVGRRRRSSGAAADELARVRAAVRATGEELGGRLRLLVGKPGLDGHSNGAEQVAVRARDVGFEVIYQGIRLTPEQIVAAAVAEDVHCVGLSVLSGSHLSLVPDVLARLRSAGLDDVPVIVGGIIPEADVRTLLASGVAAVFTPKDISMTAMMGRIVTEIRRARGLTVGADRRVSRNPLALVRRVAVDVRPLRHRDFRRIFLGQGVSYVGFQLTAVAVPVQMFSITHSSFWVGMLGFAALVPLVIFGLYGGAIADAVDRRLLYIASSCVVWAATGALLLQAILHAHSPGLLIAIVVIQTIGFSVSSPVRWAITPRLIPADLVPAGNTLNFTMSNVGTVAGPLIAGVVIAQRWLRLGLRHRRGAVHASASTPRCGCRRSRRWGRRSSRGSERSERDSPSSAPGRSCWRRSPSTSRRWCFAMPRALFPQAAVDRFHDVGAVGWLYAAIAIGSILAGLGSGWIGRVRRQGRALVFAVIGWGIAVSLAGLSHQLWLAVLLLAVAGRERPGLGGLPADHPADLRARRDARAAAGCLHRRGRGRTAARRPAGGHHGGGVRAVLVVGRRRHRVHLRGHRPGRDRARPCGPTAGEPPRPRPVSAATRSVGGVVSRRGRRRAQPAGQLQHPGPRGGQVDPHVALAPGPKSLPSRTITRPRSQGHGRGSLVAVGPQVDPGQVGRLHRPHPGGGHAARRAASANSRQLPARCSSIVSSHGLVSSYAATLASRPSGESAVVGDRRESGQRAGVRGGPGDDLRALEPGTLKALLADSRVVTWSAVPSIEAYGVCWPPGEHQRCMDLVRDDAGAVTDHHVAQAGELLRATTTGPRGCGGCRAARCGRRRPGPLDPVEVELGPLGVRVEPAPAPARARSAARRRGTAGTPGSARRPAPGRTASRWPASPRP